MRNGSDRREDDVHVHFMQQVLCEHQAVYNCAILRRTGDRDAVEIVAYVVATGPFSSEDLLAHLRSRLPGAELPDIFVPVSTLPLTALGQLDEQALARVDVIDDEVAKKWEECISALPGIAEVAVVSQEFEPTLPQIRLSELIPDWNSALAGEIAGCPRDVAPIPATEGAGRPASLSLSEGEPLAIPGDYASTLPEALRRAASRWPHHGIVYVHGDGSEVFQSYASLEEEASRILAGLESAGPEAGRQTAVPTGTESGFHPCVLGLCAGRLRPGANLDSTDLR